ncbi:MAG: tRNA 4-thiouridine(8) synthase ThiI, partial [Acutalibacteraceae bacterium]|nr:tRNA 4-thiouridine(8) synthase ThiI [Acutalibacteraceae bacterium]
MKEIILIKNGELALKGLNRSVFEDTLIKNIKSSLKNCGELTVRKAQSTIYIEPVDDSFDFDDALDRVSKVFGIA